MLTQQALCRGTAAHLLVTFSLPTNTVFLAENVFAQQTAEALMVRVVLRTVHPSFLEALGSKSSVRRYQ